MRERLVAILSCTCLLFALTLFPGIFVFGQSVGQKLNSAQALPPAKQNDSQTDVLRVTARLVQVSVIAQDSHDRQVADLTKDDFTVLDQGVQQTIASFSPWSRALAVDTAGTPAQTNDFSNRAETEAEAAPSISVILLDFMNTSLKDFSYAQTQVLKFVRQSQRRDQVAIYLLTPAGLEVLHDFTNDSVTLARVMEGPKRGANPLDESVAADNAAHKRMETAVGDAFAERYRFYSKAADKPRTTNWALQTISRRLTAIPGRKNLVWIAGRFPVNLGYQRTSAGSGLSADTDDAPTFTATAKALNDANIYVYPVGARGPSGEDILPIIDPPPPTGSAQPAPQIDGAAPNERMFRVFDIAESIRGAIQDSRESYAIGYYPDHNKWDGTFREIKIKVNRPGITLLYRGGYFATSEGTDIAAQKKIGLADAIRSPVPFVGLGLRVHAEPVETSGTLELKVDIRVSPDQMHFVRQNDRWMDSLEVVWAEIGADGRIVARGQHAFAITPTQSGYEEILRDGLSFTEHANVNGEAIELRLVVRDVGSGATGSVNISLAKIFAPSLAATPVKK
jgi:VWFA-related protein